MTVLRELSEQEGWIDIEPREDGDTASIIGYYNGTPVKIALWEEPPELKEEEQTFWSGLYELLHRIEDGQHQIKTVYHGEVSPDTTKVRQNEKGYYELGLPENLVKEIGYDEVVEMDTRTVTKTDEEGNPVYKRDKHGNKIPKTDEEGNPITDEEGNIEYETEKEEHEVTRGIKVEVDVRCNGGQLELHLSRRSPDTKQSNVRPIQHKRIKSESGDKVYDQFFIYFQRAIVASTGIADSKIDWEIGEDDEHLVGLPEEHSSVPVRESPITDESYADLAAEDRVVAIRQRSSTEQGRILFNEPQSRALGYLANKAEVYKKNEKLAILVECTEDGLTLVAHSAPEKLPEERVADSMVMTVQIHNWNERFEEMYGDIAEDESEEVREALKKAGNQMMISFPKPLAHALELLDEDIYWWPTKDTDDYYGTGENILVGVPVRDMK